MKHYETAELVELGTAAELVLGDWTEPPDNVSGDDFALPAFSDDAE